MKSKSTLQGETQDFIDDMIEFSCQTLDWCSEESERAAKQVGNVVTFLMQDAKRISVMSPEAVAFLKDFRAKAADKANATKVSDLISGLQALCSEEKAIREFAGPIVKVLQSQDRITQMMSNETRMLATWANMRSTIKSTTTLSDGDRVEFGKALLECATTVEERDLIREVIPGLPAEKPGEHAQVR